MAIANIRKALTPIVTGTLGWVALVVSSSSTDITATEWWTLGVVLATALGVYAVPNG